MVDVVKLIIFIIIFIYHIILCKHAEFKSNAFVTSQFFNPLTPRVKPWVIQSFLTFDSMDRTLKCDHSLESC